jgi:hypothetical protein
MFVNTHKDFLKYIHTHVYEDSHAYLCNDSLANVRKDSQRATKIHKDPQRYTKIHKDT